MAIAPTGAAGLCWHEGELELAKAAARAKIPFTLATGAMTSMEKIAREANFRLWFQLYVWKQRELSYQLIERAKHNGFEALIVTTDTIVPPNREYNAKNGFLLPFHPTWRFTWDIMQHPAWFTHGADEVFHAPSACRGTRTIRTRIAGRSAPIRARGR